MMHDNCITALSVSSDSQFLASVSQDGFIKVWRMSKGTCLKKFENTGAAITCCMFGKNDSQVITGSDRVKVWGLNSGKKVNEFGLVSNCFINSIQHFEEDFIITTG